MTQTALILGGSGRFGRNATLAFQAAGWTTRQFDRKTDDLMQAAQGADVIVNAWNPPYDKWQAQVPDLHAQVIAAAQASGATVIVPGNVYVFGKDAPARFAPDTPHRARNILGRIRIDMEAAYRASGVPTIVLRAGDFLDTEASGNWFDLMMANKLAKGRFTYPGRTDVPHGWAFLPDMARAAVQLAEMRDQLARFEDIPFPGYTLTGQDMARAVSAAAGHDVRLKQMNWLPLYLASPFWKMGRHLLEMRYLWNKSHHLDGTRFRELLPDFAETPLQDALSQTLAPLSKTAGPKTASPVRPHPA